MQKQFASMVIVLVASAAVSLPAHAQEIPDRPTLNSLLRTSTTEGFENYTIQDVGTNAEFIFTTVLDSTTIANGEGPGLIVPGITFSGGNPGTGIQWDGAGYFGAPSKEILVDTHTLTLDFASPTDAFGVDLRSFASFANDAVVTIFAADDTTIIHTSSSLSLSGSGLPVFYGFKAVGNIGKVVFTSTQQAWSPIVDNLTFGPVAPEPASLSLMGMTCLSLVGFLRRRK